MRGQALHSIVLILSSAACVDRINIDVDTSTYFPVVIDGYISDQPGPYKIKITKAFDIQSKYSLREPVSVKRLVISDDRATSEVLTQVSHGVYQTSPTGIRGTVGRVYKLNIELLDGRVYETKPDTLYPAGTIDSVYHKFKEVKTDTLITHGFDVLFNSSSGVKNKYNFLWKFVGTFQADTNPELYDTLCVEARCPKPLPCSSYVLNKITGELQNDYKPCLCCTCWYDFFNIEPLISSNQFIQNGRFTSVKATYIPVNQWTFMYKVHAEVRQLSLSRQAFDFWKAVKAQQGAAASLFQPVTGKIVSNFVQISGPTAEMEGLFFATSITSKAIFITREDVPNQLYIPPQNLPFKNTCRALFPNSTTIKPTYWN